MLVKARRRNHRGSDYAYSIAECAERRHRPAVEDEFGDERVSVQSLQDGGWLTRDEGLEVRVGDSTFLLTVQAR